MTSAEHDGSEMLDPKIRDYWENEKKPITIDHPVHYGGDTPYEAIKVIEAWELNFNLGNAAKYICRAGKKGSPLEDLKKAKWYLEREIVKRS